MDRGGIEALGDASAFGLGDETIFHGPWREWRRRLGDACAVARQPRLVAAGAVAAQVGEDVAELGGVQVVGQGPPSQGGAEPAVQRDDVMVAASDLEVRASHGS